MFKLLLSLFLFFLGTEWVQANTDLCERQGFVVRDLPVGEKINFRVVAVNIAGRSPPATLGQPVTIREIVGEYDRCNSSYQNQSFQCVLSPHSRIIRVSQQAINTVTTACYPLVLIANQSLLQNIQRSAFLVSWEQNTSGQWEKRSTWPSHSRFEQPC